MKISIDTKEDSHEEIKKIIKMLSSLVGEEVVTNQPEVISDNKPSSDIFSNDKSSSVVLSDNKSSSDIFSDSSSQPSNAGVFNMFNSPQPENKTEPQEEKKETLDLGIHNVEEYD